MGQDWSVMGQALIAQRAARRQAEKRLAGAEAHNGKAVGCEFNRPPCAYRTVFRLVVRRVNHAEVAAGLVPEVALDEEVAAAEGDVGPSAVSRLILEVAESPGALVGVLRAAAVGPARVRVGVGGGLFEFVGDDRKHAVNARVAVRAGGLRSTGRQTAVGVTDEGEA